MTSIAVFVNHPECSVESAHGIIRSLSADYAVDCFGPDQIRDNYLSKFDVLAFPGGIGDSESFHRIIGDRADVVRNQIALGKYYLGICMGAYWAGSHYFDIVKNINPVQYIKRRRADIRRSFGTVAEVTWSDRTEYMYFYDGCALVGTARPKVIARYANGDPAAIIQGKIGLIGPHPESDIYWYNQPYLQTHWHGYRHHYLLLDFVNRLVK